MEKIIVTKNINHVTVYRKRNNKKNYQLFVEDCKKERDESINEMLYFYGREGQLLGVNQKDWMPKDFDVRDVFSLEIHRKETVQKLKYTFIDD